MTDHIKLEAKQYDDIFSPREISKIKQELFWVMQPTTVDRLPLEIYQDFLRCLRRDEYTCTYILHRLGYSMNENEEKLLKEYYRISTEIETLNTILE